MRLAHLTSNVAGEIVSGVDDLVAQLHDGVEQIFVFNHGWRESDQGARDFFDANTPSLGARWDDRTVCACHHWQSTDPFGGLSFYVMERRAALVGRTAAMRIAAIVAARTPTPLRVHFGGHSDGAIVSINALAAIGEGNWRKGMGDTFALTLWEAACPSNYMESGQQSGACLNCYPDTAITLSNHDLALRIGFTAAEFLEFRNDCLAMGAVGTTDRTKKDLGPLLSQLDLTSIHAARPWYGDDHHCDVELPAVWDLTTRK